MQNERIVEAKWKDLVEKTKNMRIFQKKCIFMRNYLHKCKIFLIFAGGNEKSQPNYYYERFTTEC